MKTTTPFDFVNSILTTKIDLLATGEYEEREYAPWLVNAALSQYPDTLMAANAMNGFNHLSNSMQYHYLLNIVRPMKRKFSKWAKKAEDGDLEVVCQYYGYNRNKGRSALALLSSDQLQKLKDMLDQGGKR